MHTGSLKKLALALTFWLALHAGSLKAQSLPLGPYTSSESSAIVFQVDQYGVLSSTGTFGVGTGDLSLSGAGTEMFWYPGKAAFRAGSIDGSQWNDSNIGNYSIALGFDTIASGWYSTAFGYKAVASSGVSVAFGNGSTASGYNSIAMGTSAKASSNAAIAAGPSANASASSSLALGGYSTASGKYSAALGYGSTANGQNSFALSGTATGYGSFAIGFGVTSAGSYATAMGHFTTASSFDSFVVGQYNIGGGSSTTWVDTDPLFEIGNGTGPYTGQLSDAMVVYKNGDAEVQGNLSAGGVVTAQPGGDIPMYSGN